jgi:hypothetical protein
MVCPDGAHHLQVPRAAHTGHFSPERFGNLNRKRTYTTGRTINQDLLPRLNLSFIAAFIAETLQGDECILGYGRCFLIGYVDRFQR